MKTEQEVSKLIRDIKGIPHQNEWTRKAFIDLVEWVERLQSEIKSLKEQLEQHIRQTDIRSMFGGDIPQ